MGLLDYYRQFDDIDERELNRERRARRERERALALAEVPALDLSSTEWPDFPSSEIVNASIFAARGRVNGYPDPHASEVRRLLAARHGVNPEQIVVGNGAAELLQTTVLASAGPGTDVVMPWPTYPLFPLLARRAGARAVPVDLRGDRVDPEAVAAAVSERTRLVTICNPNDPTGTYLTSDELGTLLSELPERVHVVVDEAYVQFEDVEPEDSCLRLVDAFPRLLVLRTFSKIYGLSGLRAGYAVAGPGAAELLARIAPTLGISVLTQAGVAQALKIGDRELERRRALVIGERRRLLDALHDLPVDAPSSQANFVWMRASALNAAQLAAGLERDGLIVAPGGPLGADDHVRVTIRGTAATDRLLASLDRLTAAGG